jgi:hypothetical protein
LKEASQRRHFWLWTKVRSSYAERLVTGAGGFIGHHLVTYPKLTVTGSELRMPKTPSMKSSAADEFFVVDLRHADDCLAATCGVQEVYALAADMGGMGFISSHHAQILRDNALNRYPYAGSRAAK